MRRLLLSAIFSLSAFNTYAETVECQILTNGDTLETELVSGIKFNNCFSPNDVSNLAKLQVITYSNDNVRTRLTAYDIDKPLGNNYISEYNSDPLGDTALTIAPNNRKLGFRIVPTSHRTADKNINVSYLIVDGVGQLVFDIDDIPSTAEELPEAPGCKMINGRWTCNEFQ